MSRVIIGLTGGIGSGKTTVSDHFAKLGIDVIDADVIAREVVEPGTPALTAIVERFGSDILQPDGALDRAQLRQKVFTAPEEKNWLNGLLHPLIREQMQQQTQNATSAYCILSVPLLIENQLTAMVDRVLVVDLDEQTQLERACARDQNQRQQIQAIMNSQVTREQRRQAADDIVDNQGTTEELIAQIEQRHRQYLALSIAKDKDQPL